MGSDVPMFVKCVGRDDAHVFWVKGTNSRSLGGARFYGLPLLCSGWSLSATLPRSTALPHRWEDEYAATHRSSALPCIAHLGLQQRNVFFGRFTEKLVLSGLPDEWKGHGPRI